MSHLVFWNEYPTTMTLQFNNTNPTKNFQTENFTQKNILPSTWVLFIDQSFCRLNSSYNVTPSFIFENPGDKNRKEYIDRVKSFLNTCKLNPLNTSVWTCLDLQTNVQVADLCNGIQDCNDGSDEVDTLCKGKGYSKSTIFNERKHNARILYF